MRPTEQPPAHGANIVAPTGETNLRATAARRPGSLALACATPWLTPNPAAPELTAHDAPEGVSDEDAGAIAAAATTALLTAQTTTRKITEDFSPDYSTALSPLLAQTEAPGPWKLAGDHQPGLIPAAEHALPCVVDIDNECPDDMATARAVAIALAANAPASVWATVEG